MLIWISLGFGKSNREHTRELATDSVGYYESKQYKSLFDERVIRIIRSKEAG